MSTSQAFRQASLGVFITGALTFAVAWTTIRTTIRPTIPDFRTHGIFEPQTTPKVYFHVKATAYCACRICCGKWSGGPTASGVMPLEGRTIAADISVFGFGTCLALPRWGVRVVEDTGRLIKGNRIDVYFKSHTEAFHFGVQYFLAHWC